MGGGSSRRQSNLLLPPVSINRPVARLPPRYLPPAIPFPTCGPRIVQCPPQVRILPPLPPRIVQLPPRFVPAPCLPAPPPPTPCLPQPALRCLPGPQPLRCLPNPCLPNPCLPNPCLPNPCLPNPCFPNPCLPCLPNPCAPSCLPYTQQPIIPLPYGQRPYGQYLAAAPVGAAVGQYFAAPGGHYMAAPRPQYLAGAHAIQPVQPQHIPHAIDSYYPGPPGAVRPASHLPSRQIEYVPTPVKQIDYTPPSLSRQRQIAYSNGKVSRRSDYDDFDDVAGVRPEAATAEEDLANRSSAGKFVFHTPGLDSSADQQQQQLSPGTRLEYAPENASTRAHSATLSQAQYRIVPQGVAADGSALTQQTSSQAGIQYRLISDSAADQQQAAADAAAAADNGQQQYRLISSSNAPTPYRVLTGQPESIAQQALDASTASNQYRLVQNTAQSGVNEQAASQYRLVQNTAQSGVNEQAASVTNNQDGQEYVEAVSEDGVHYHPVLPQPILTNVKLANGTLTQRSSNDQQQRTISSLQYLLNNYNSNNNNQNISSSSNGNINDSSINNLINSLNNNNNNNTYSIARSAGTLSQQQLQQDPFQGQDTIEIPVQVPVKVRIPAPNSANKQQTYNTTIECRQKPYCPSRDDQQQASN